MQLSLFREVSVKHKFSTALMNKEWKYVVDKKGILVPCKRRELTLEEAKELISKAVEIERMNYGWNVNVVDNNKNLNIYFRFENVTTRSKESPEDFITKNWEG